MQTFKEIDILVGFKLRWCRHRVSSVIFLFEEPSCWRLTQLSNWKDKKAFDGACQLSARVTRLREVKHPLQDGVKECLCK